MRPFFFCSALPGIVVVATEQREYGFDQPAEDSGPRAVRALGQTAHQQQGAAGVVGSAAVETGAVPVQGQEVHAAPEFVRQDHPPFRREHPVDRYRRAGRRR